MDCEPSISYRECMDSVRTLVAAKIEELGLDLRSVSMMIGRNHAYMQQYLKRNIPAELPEKVRQKLAAVLGVPESSLGGPKDDTPPRAPNPLFDDRELLALYSGAEGGDGFVIVGVDPLEYIARPRPLVGINDAYAIVISNESMSPAFEPGDKAYVNPRMPLKEGKNFIFYFSATDEGDRKAMIKRLVHWTDSEWTVEQYNPPKRFKLPRSSWVQAHRVIGKMEV